MYTYEPSSSTRFRDITPVAALQSNRWRKRSLALVPISYHINLAFRYPALVSVYDKDGTVAVSHGGVEMGQGINTKVSQGCAEFHSFEHQI